MSSALAFAFSTGLLTGVGISVGVALYIYWKNEERQKHRVGENRPVGDISYRHAIRQLCVKGGSSSRSAGRPDDDDDDSDDDDYKPPPGQSTALNLSLRLVLCRLVTNE